jgi:hypothetical protein
MGRSKDRVTVIEVIRPDAKAQQPLKQTPQGFQIVIDAFQEDGLAPQGDAGVGQPRARLRRLGREFVGMDEV